jgi:Carboxypeptidase regulatory-like domain
MMPRANIIATETAKGVCRVASTDGSGSFLITGLEPATYDVSVQMTGFATEIRKGVAVAIRQTVTLDFQLKVSEVATAIEVSDVPPVVETQRASQSDTVAGRYIDDLPISRRDALPP